MPIDAPGKVFGLPTWAVVVTLGAAGVVGYLIFFKNSGGSSSSGTSGSTYSAQGLAVMQNPDESATMALQNELLSKIGLDMQTGFGAIDTHIGQVGDSVDSGFSSVGTSLNGLSGQVSGVSGQVSGVSGQVGQLSASESAHYSQMASALQALGNSLSAGQSALGQQMGNYYNGLAQQINNAQASNSTLDAGLQQQLNNIGSFLGWQFYQLPNRYAAYLPTSNLNVSQN